MRQLTKISLFFGTMNSKDLPNEFFMLFQFFTMLDNSSWLQPLFQKYPVVNFIGWVFGKIYHLFFLPHCFLPFPLLKSRKFIPVMTNTYFGVFLFFGSWYLWRPLAKLILAPKRRQEEASTEAAKKQE